MKKQDNSKVQVTQKEGKEIATQVLADKLVKMGDIVAKIEQGDLNHEAIVVLLMYKTKLGRTVVEKVLKGLVDLAPTYTNKGGK